MQPNDLKTLGFPSWLALYTFLRENGHHQSDRVRIIQAREAAIAAGGEEPIPSPHGPVLDTTVLVDVEYVKARAFEELYSALPSRETLDILVEIAQEATVRTPDCRLITTFLTKQPTRTNEKTETALG